MVNTVVAPVVKTVLTNGRADVVSVGFLISLWAGSSATATFVNTITLAYGMRYQRSAWRSRLLAFELYLLGVLGAIIVLPLLVLGPGEIVAHLPAARPDREDRLLAGRRADVHGRPRDALPPVGPGAHAVAS